jgi:predicted ester cyclase
MEPFCLLTAGHTDQRPDRDETAAARQAAHKAIVRRFVEDVLNRGEVALLDELVADDHIDHGPLGNHCGLESIRRDLLACRAAFPDLRYEIVDLVAEGDLVARRFEATGTHLGDYLSTPPTGRRVRVAGLAIDRIAAGKLAETWSNVDLFGLLRQIGAIER